MNKWIKTEVSHPMENIEVHVVTFSGDRGVARYWEATKSWLTKDKKLKNFDGVLKWKYEHAKYS